MKSSAHWASADEGIQVDAQAWNKGSDVKSCATARKGRARIRGT